MWSIIIINGECPYLIAVRKTVDPFYPCVHELNMSKVCKEQCCPIKESDVLKRRIHKEVATGQGEGCMYICPDDLVVNDEDNNTGSGM